MTKGKVWEKKNLWWILLGVLCVAIVGLGIWITVNFINNKDFESNLDKFTSEISESYSEDLLSTNGALVFYNYIFDKKEDENLDNQSVYNLYEDVLKQIDGEVRLSYLSYYATLYYDLEGDIDGAIDIVKRFESEIGDNRDLQIDYYATLSGLYSASGDDETAEYYDDLLTKLVPSEVYGENEEE